MLFGVGVSSIFGLPFSVASVVLSVNHVRALKDKHLDEDLAGFSTTIKYVIHYFSSLKWRNITTFGLGFNLTSFSRELLIRTLCNESDCISCCLLEICGGNEFMISCSHFQGTKIDVTVGLYFDRSYSNYATSVELCTGVCVVWYFNIGSMQDVSWCTGNVSSTFNL